MANARSLEVTDSTALLCEPGEVLAESRLFHPVSPLRPHQRSCRISVIFGLATVLTFVFASCLRLGDFGPERHAARNLARFLVGATLVTPKMQPAVHIYMCGAKEENIDYVYATLAGAGHIDNIGSADQCCALCTVEPDCRAYTWVKDARLWFGNPGQCWLKGGHMVDKAAKEGVVSALVNGPVSNTTANRLSDEEDAYQRAQREELEAAINQTGSKRKIMNMSKKSEAEKRLQQRAEKLAQELSSQNAADDLMKNLSEGLAANMGKETALAEELSASAATSIANSPDRPSVHSEGDTVDEQPEETTEPSNESTTDTPKETEESHHPQHQDVSSDQDQGCGGQNEGCLESQCCKDPGYQCYTKNDYWAQCMPACYKGPNPVDQVSSLPWECKELGDRTPGELQLCSETGENCIRSKCCMKAGSTCFTKNATFALCKPSCSPGPDLKADDDQPWSCDKLGRRTPGSAPWVPNSCSKVGADCSNTACCAEPGHQCYQQSPWYAQCKPVCTPGEQVEGTSWSCGIVGWRTPTLADDAEEAKGQIGAWVERKCAKNGDNCLKSQCCHAVGAQCFKKNEYWAACKLTCSSTPDPKDNNESWSCEPLGPKSWGLATKGFPSLYCVTLYMPSGYEGELLKHHISVNGGIFVCDGYDVFAAEDDTLGTTLDDILVKPVLIPKIRVGMSQDGTAGNAKLFMAVWDRIIAAGRFRNYDWTIKVDPDAVMLPWRVREHMLPHVGKKVYVVNCNKFPDSPNFPMMYGSLEIFSGPAMAEYAARSGSCGKELPWEKWGEDYFMTKCMDYIGVGRVADFGVIGDDVCTGANCADTYTGAFHPFKDVGSWHDCWVTATQAENEG